MSKWRNLRWLFLLSLFFGQFSYAERIKDLASIQGVRSNALIGYGLVVGLNGTGEQTVYTAQTFKTMLSRFGITLPPGLNPKLKNIAAVAVHGELPAFAKPGQKIDVTVSSLGDAKSLHGGSLLLTPLKAIDGQIYAIAQGNLVVGGFGAQGSDGSKITINIPTAGRIPNGAMVERSVPNPFAEGSHLVFNLNQSDFTTARRLSKAINKMFGPNIAKPLDATSVKVSAPRDPSQRVAFLSVLENINVEPADTQSKIIINSRTGTIVVGKHVRVQEAAISHGNLVVTITENNQVIQPNPLADGETAVQQQADVDVELPDSRMFHFKPGVSLNELVQAVNAVGAAPGDLMAILEALKQAGAIQGELVVI
ncbi:flagellar basal body P-ring protein FlgI [Pleionea sp. CnH1-48]|uniref:flagellar basal body P-ring protein FlgI n=1 Tax=Pleionea sp. CnH1-48 TaxID=2954494 RepID=UPI0020973609|nr:flagellar basal body P-ring protein FlgI [Pleionea sp. CnH1-48]MCO7226154.1 flagellar basal body P-ring protein FlgI [Pleionea sp. CnH1-48]